MLTTAPTHSPSMPRLARFRPLNVVICGGGVAAVEAALAVRDLAGDRIDLTFVSPRREFVLVPLAVGAPFAAAHVPRWPLAGIAHELHARYIEAAVAHVDADAHRAHLSDDAILDYDVLLLATGARRVAPFEHVQTFRADDPGAVGGLLADLEEGWSRSVAFVVPPGVSWTLPAYELALLTAGQLYSMAMDKTQITLVTPEARPLALFGARASAAAGELLERAGVAFRGNAYVHSVLRGRGLRLDRGHEELQVERVLTLPRVEGLPIDGLPHDRDGFLPIDDHASVIGIKDVFAAGDGADFPVKQGGLATQQADAAAEGIAQQAGANVVAQPFRPVLRGWLLTGAEPLYFANPIAGGAGPGVVSTQPLWSPMTKVAGRYLAPWLWAHSQGRGEPISTSEAMPVESAGSRVP